MIDPIESAITSEHSRQEAASRERADAPQHTPGPWQTNCSHIYAPDGAIIAVVHNPGTKASDYPLIANRNLMATAPELYGIALVALDVAGALKAGSAVDAEMIWLLDAHVANIEAAIAKVRGDA